MKLDWKLVNKDYVAKHNSLVFRLKDNEVGICGRGGRCYSLQARKIDEIKFEYLGYAFVVKDDGNRAVEEYSVDKKLWNSVAHIKEKAEEILGDLMFI